MVNGKMEFQKGRESSTNLIRYYSMGISTMDTQQDLLALFSSIRSANSMENLNKVKQME
jgi:hypothetical protein